MRFNFSFYFLNFSKNYIRLLHKLELSVGFFFSLFLCFPPKIMANQIFVSFAHETKMDLN